MFLVYSIQDQIGDIVDMSLKHYVVNYYCFIEAFTRKAAPLIRHFHATHI